MNRSPTTGSLLGNPDIKAPSHTEYASSLGPWCERPSGGVVSRATEGVGGCAQRPLSMVLNQALPTEGAPAQAKVLGSLPQGTGPEVEGAVCDL